MNKDNQHKKIQLLLRIVLINACLLSTPTWPGHAGTYEEILAFLQGFVSLNRAGDDQKRIQFIIDNQDIAFQAATSLVEENVIKLASGVQANPRLPFGVAWAIAADYRAVVGTRGLLNLVETYERYSVERAIERITAGKLNQEGTVLFEQSDFSHALIKFKQALSIYHQLDDTLGQARLVMNSAHAYTELSQFGRALEGYADSLQLYDQLGDRCGVATLLRATGGLYNKLDQAATALEFLTQSEKQFNESPSCDGQLDLPADFGASYIKLGRYQEGESRLNAAIQEYRARGDRYREATARQVRAMLYGDIGRYLLAVDDGNFAADVFHEQGNSIGEAHALQGLGVAHQLMGQYSDAMRYYRKALQLYSEAKNQAGEAEIIGNMGMLYLALRDYELAKSLLAKSLDISQQLGITGSEANARMNMGLLYSEFGQLQEAALQLEEAAKLFSANNDPLGIGRLLTNVASMYAGMGQYAKGKALAERALELAQQYSISSVKVAASGVIAQALHRLGESDAAVSVIMDTIGAAEEMQSLEYQWSSYGVLGRILRDTGDLLGSVEAFDQGVRIENEIYRQGKWLSENSLMSLIGSKKILFRDYLEVLFRAHEQDHNSGYDRTAFVVSDMGRSRLFQDLLRKSSANISFSGDENFQKMLDKERQYEVQINHLYQQQHLLSDRETLLSINDQLVKLTDQLISHQKVIDKAYPRYADLKRPAPLSVEKLQQLLLPAEVLLAYSIGNNESLAFVVHKKEFYSVPLQMGQPELADLLRRFRGGLDDVAAFDELIRFDPVISFELYKAIFLPIRDYLQGKTRLIIVPDDALYTLPFEALIDRSIDREEFADIREAIRENKLAYLSEYQYLSFLVDTYTFSYLPSISSLFSLRSLGKEGYGEWPVPLVAFADPIFSRGEKNANGPEKLDTKDDSLREPASQAEMSITALKRATGRSSLERLRASGSEASAIASVVGATDEHIYLRERATEENVYAAKLSDARYLLFSTHGFLGGDFTGVTEPSLVLSLVDNPPNLDGILTMSEVLGLNLNSELTILSACNTAGHSNVANSGEGFIGLTRSFMYAGSNSIIVSHWSVESEATSDLLKFTIEKMQNTDLASAFQSAKLAIKTSTRPMGQDLEDRMSLSHPYFWAPFVLLGDSGQRSSAHD